MSVAYHEYDGGGCLSIDSSAYRRTAQPSAAQLLYSQGGIQFAHGENELKEIARYPSFFWMKIYQFWPGDTKFQFWMAHDFNERSPGHTPKSECRDLVCSVCGKFDHDEIFKRAAWTEFNYTGSNDILCSLDGFYCVNQRFVAALEQMGVAGNAVFSRIGKSRWWAMCITNRRTVIGEVFIPGKGACQQCTRPKEVLGGVMHLGQLEILNEKDRLFSTNLDRSCSGLSDRNWFASDDVVFGLREHEIKGGVFRLLYEEKQHNRHRESWKSGELKKMPKEATIVL